MTSSVEQILLEENKSDKKIKFYDDRTLSIETGKLTPSQVCTALQATMMTIRVKFGIPAYFHMAYVMTKDESGKIVPKGWCYLTVNRPEVYHLLLGRKADGSENVDFIQDPDWIAPSDDEVDEDDELDLPPLPDFHAKPANDSTPLSWGDFPSFNMSWADIMKDEIEREERKLEREPRMIKVYLDPLIPKPSIMTPTGLYTIEIVASRVNVHLEESKFLSIDTNKVQGYFPNSISVREIENYFKPFSSSPKFPEVIETKIRGPQPRNGGQPTRLVILKFKSTSHDALFVIQTNLRCTMIDKTNHRHVIYLSHPPAKEGK